MKKLNQEEFIKKCIEIHNHKYEYNLVEYSGVRNNIIIICKEHGQFIKNAKKHKEGQGCPKCSGYFNLTKDEFIEKYGKERYDYSLVTEPFKISSHIYIIDKETNLTYIQLADHHKNGLKPTKIESKSLVRKLKYIHNDQFDYIIEKEFYYLKDKIRIIDKLTNDASLYRIDRHLSGMKPNKVTLKHFLIKSNEIHNHKYDYSLIKEISSNLDKVDIICKEHGVFSQRVSNHLNMGDGCPKCVGKGVWNTELLIERFKNIHLDKFDYSKVIFENIEKKVKIVCKEHGDFYQNIHKHLNGQGCALCENSSKGEEYIKMWLDELNINYIRQHTFEGCRFINPLYFDFYLPEYNLLIEFDGKQHFMPVKWFGGDDVYQKILERDKVKNDWCLSNGVGLLRIKYDEFDRIKYIIKEKLQIKNEA